MKRRPPCTPEELRAASSKLDGIIPIQPPGLSVVARPTAATLYQAHIEHRLPFSDGVRLMSAAPLLLATLADTEKELTCLLSRLQQAIAKATEAQR
jgi:hypothetical protein